MICTSFDDYVKYKPIWIAELLDGTLVYQDDERDGLDIPVAWRRLHQYVNIHKTKIVDLYLRFRSHIMKPLPRNADGYFFCNKILQPISTTKKFIINFYVIGAVKNKMVFTQTYKIPELLLAEQKIRQLKNCEDYVICNKIG